VARAVHLEGVNSKLTVSGVPMACARRILRHRDIDLTSEVHPDKSCSDGTEGGTCAERSMVR